MQMSAGSVTLCVSCGIPASGKTTYWRNFYKSFESCNSKTNLLVIEYDKIIPQDWLIPKDAQSAQNSAQGEREENKSWKSFRFQLSLVVEALIQSVKLFGKCDPSKISQPDRVTADIWKNIQPLLLSVSSKWQDSEGQLVIIIDDNMYFRSMRYDYFKLARKYSTGFCQVLFNCSATVAIGRNKDRTVEQQVPQAVILRMAEKLEPPDSENYAWERSSFVMEMENYSAVNHQSIVQLLMSSLLNPVQAQSYPDEQELIKSQVQSSISLLHQGDLILRKCVAAWMTQCKKSMPARDLQNRAKEALKAKETIMITLKEDPASFGVSDVWTIESSSSDPSSDFYKFISEAFFQRTCNLPR